MHRAVHGATGGTGQACLAASRATHFRRPYRPSGVIWTCPVTGLAVEGEVRTLFLDQSVCDGPVSDAGRPFPGPVGPCSDPQALLAQDTEDRLDCIALGAHLVDEREGSGD